MERVSVRIPEYHIEELKKFVDTGIYPTISEAVRDAIRKLTDKYMMK